MGFGFTKTSFRIMSHLPANNVGMLILDSFHYLASKINAIFTCFVVAGLFYNPALSQEVRSAHCFAGCPDGHSAANSLIIRPIYTLSYNHETKIADWAAYSVTMNSIGIASNLSRIPVVDNHIAETLVPGDFDTESGSTMLYGQLVPLQNFAGTPFWQDTNYLTNGIPISRSLNTGAWTGLDWSIRNLVNRVGEVFVLVGPIYLDEPEMEELNGQYRVPDAYFKIVIANNGDSSAFLLSQKVPVHTHHCQLVSTLEEIESLSNLSLLPELRLRRMADLNGALGC